MRTTCVCLFVLLFCGPVLASYVVWMKMSEEAINSVSADMIELYPDQVFDLSGLVVNTSQLQIYSVDVHSPGGVTSRVGVSQVNEGKFDATWMVDYLVIDVKGQAQLGRFKFGIDSRIILRNTTLSLRYALDEKTMLSATSCGFGFTTESIILKDRSLQRFVGVWRSTFERMPARAICSKIGQLHRNQPLFMFGLPVAPHWISVVPRAVKIRDSYFYIAFKDIKETSPVSNTDVPPDIQMNQAAMLTVFFPPDFFSDVIDHVIDDALHERFIGASNARVPVEKLGEYFEEGDSLFEGKPGYHAISTIDIKQHGTRITEDGLFSTVPFTFNYNASSKCGTYRLFSLDWNLEISSKVIYNDRNFYLRVSDIRSRVTLTDSKLGNPKDLPKLVQDLRISVFLKDELSENLSFFMNNTGVLHNTVLTGRQNYILLTSNTSSQHAISSWKHFGTTFSGDDIETNSNMELVDQVNVQLCENDSVSKSGSQSVTYSPLLAIWVMTLSSAIKGL